MILLPLEIRAILFYITKRLTTISSFAIVANMNIFILSYDMKESASFQVKKHCIKMPLESAQLLSTCHRVLESDQAKFLYKKTHVNHPCSIWVRESKSNYEWLFNFLLAQFEEFRFRRGKAHSSERLVDLLSNNPVDEDIGLTPFALCMPDHYKTECAVESYRNFYNGDKYHLFEWDKRPKPEWAIY